MSDILKRLKKVEEEKSKAEARFQVAEERLVELRNKLGELGIESNVDIEKLKNKIDEEMKKVTVQLDEAEELLSNINLGRSTDGK